MKKFVTIGMVIMFALVAANAETMSEKEFVAELEDSDIQFIYSTSDKTKSSVTIIKTEDTAEAIADLIESKPVDLSVEVVEYITRGRAGYELNYENDERE
jgi:hypothetical protein